MSISRFSKVNRISAFVMAAFLCFSFCACSEGNPQETEIPTEPAKYSIGVIQSSDDASSEHTYQGFTSAFTDKGYYQSEFHSLSVVNCKGDKDKCKEAAEKFVSEGVNLIFAIGEPAAVAAAKATDTIPVIFSGVTDPIEAGLLKSCEKPDKNVTGVSDMTPVAEQLSLIKELFPKAKKVSSLYMTTNENSILLSTLAQSSAESAAIEYTPFTAGDENQLDSAINNALEDCDVLYLIDDELTFEHADTIVKAANKKKVPIVSSSEALLAKGALATSVPDYTDMGYNAGELALIILKNLRTVSDLSVEYPEVCKDKINVKVAESFSVDTSVIEGAVLFKGQ